MKKRQIVKANSEAKKLVNFLFETRILKYLPRGALPYLKTPLKENVAEHSFYTTIIAWILAELEKANKGKVIKMALIHDLAEIRGGERNLINKFYTQQLNEVKIIEEVSQTYNLRSFEISKLFQEFFKEETKEAKIVKDADILAGMLLEKECLELGNKTAKKWLAFSFSRLKTKKGKNLGKLLIKVDSDAWFLDLVGKFLPWTKSL